jgi:hypothetical protein
MVKSRSPSSCIWLRTSPRDPGCARQPTRENIEQGISYISRLQSAYISLDTASAPTLFLRNQEQGLLSDASCLQYCLSHPEIDSTLGPAARRGWSIACVIFFPGPSPRRLLGCRTTYTAVDGSLGFTRPGNRWLLILDTTSGCKLSSGYLTCRKVSFDSPAWKGSPLCTANARLRCGERQATVAPRSDLRLASPPPRPLPWIADAALVFPGIGQGRPTLYICFLVTHGLCAV